MDIEYHIIQHQSEKVLDPKMDLPMALTIMGFRTTIALEGLSYDTMKANLDEAHTKRMLEIQVI